MEANAAAGAAARFPRELLSLWQERFQRGDAGECIALARNFVEQYPATGKAWQLLGASLLAAGRAADALPALRRASALAPNDWSVWDNLGLALQRLADFDAAAAAFANAVRLAPGEARARSNASANAFESGNLDDALSLAQEAIRLAPNLAAAHLTAGNALCAAGRIAEAEAELEHALALQPRYFQAMLSLGRAQSQRGRFAQAADTTRGVLAIKPDYPEAHVNLAHCLNALGDITSAIAHYRRALALNPDMIAAGSGALFCMLHDDSQSAEQVFAAHAEFGTRLEAPCKAGWKRHANMADPDRRLRLGFVSGDLRDHPVARFLEPVWRELDRGHFDLFAYDTQPNEDATAVRLRALADRWTVAAAMPDALLDARIRADGVDILFDLSGHTAHNRLGVFARRPAPLQITWIGYPGSTGLTAMDYRLTDQVIAPPGRFDHLFTERLAYLPFMTVFDQPRELPEVDPAPCLGTGQLTFGSFNRLNKLGDRSLKLWARVIERVPDARLLIGAMPDMDAADVLRRRFAAVGIDDARLIFHPRMAMADYLRLHGRIDMLLDALPFSSGTTANFALWMGVPTLTLAGDSMAQRLGAGRMHAAGLDGFIAGSDDEFVDLAVDWCRRRDELALIRSGLRERMEGLSAAQSTQLTRALEQRLREMWRRWCDGLAPERLGHLQ